MVAWACLALAALVCLLPAGAYGADKTGWLFSPGELSEKHAKYEGLGNCTLCHKVGGGLPDSNCLDCHDKLAARMKKGEGVHARFKDRCIVCHVEHMGRKHSLINIVEKDFNHSLTGYGLEGAHAKAECRQCHKTQGVYTGQVRECVSCHKDRHEKQLGGDCARCHAPSGWKDVRFSHAKDSRFALKGAHARVECAKCHANGRFKGLEYRGCGTADCHGDRHKGQFGKRECTSCHKDSMEGWAPSGFDHSSAAFALKGKHAKAPCAKCHADKRFRPVEHGSCGAANCHGDRHKGQFGKKECTECHSKAIESWSAKDAVEHWKTNFRLRGRHDRIECSKCHVNGKFKGMEYNGCGAAACHGDFHKGQAGNRPCTACHQEDIVSWKVRGIFDHTRVSEFALRGRHAKLECSKCHSRGHLKPIEHAGCGASNCHGNRHEGQIKDKACLDCHDREAFNWRIYRPFDHAAEAGYALRGKHLKVECSKCHVKARLKPIEHKACGDCHRHEHRKAVGTKACIDCHDRDSATWNVSTDVFDHVKEARYALTGSHADLRCSQCHKAGKFRFEGGCANCHAPKDVHEKMLGERCEKCHSPGGWKTTSFDHNRDTPFALVKEHALKECSKCHATKLFVDTPKRCEGCHGKTGVGRARERQRKDYEGLP